MNLEYKSASDHITIGEAGTFTGYASVFGVVDDHQDVISPNAFDDDINRGHHIKLLWQHNPNLPIGKITSLSTDNHGLKFTAKLNLDIKQAQEAYALIKHGDINSLSIGFIAKKRRYDAERNCQIIERLKLIEISVVTFPANQHATINQIKQQAIMNANNSNNTNIDTTTENHQFTQQLQNLAKKFDDQFLQLKTTLNRPQVQTSAAGKNNTTQKAFNHYLKSGDYQDLATKSLSSTAENGGLFIPHQQQHQLYNLLDDFSLLRKLASVTTITTDGLDVIDDYEQLQAGWTQETQARSDTNTPKISKRRIGVAEMYAQPKATQQLIDDSAIDIGNWLTAKMAQAFAALENHSFLYGSGKGQPRGILTYEHGEKWQQIQQISTSKPKDPLNADDLIKFIYALPSVFRQNASIIMNTNVIAKIRSLKTSDGRYLWQPALSDKEPSSILGIPVFESNLMPNLEPGNIVAAIADFKQAYTIVDRQGISVLRDPFTEKPFVKFYTTKRVGADISDFRAIKLLKLAA